MRMDENCTIMYRYTMYTYCGHGTYYYFVVHAYSARVP